MWKYWIRAFQPEGSWERSDYRYKAEKDLGFLAGLAAWFSGKNARTVQRPKGGVPQHPENPQETALRKTSVFKAYSCNATKDGQP